MWWIGAGHWSGEFVHCRRLEDFPGWMLRCSAGWVFPLPVKKWRGAVETPRVVDFAAIPESQVPFNV